jgi:hypothetical protein
MSFNEINSLRKDGQLQEAFELAKKEIQKSEETGDSVGLLWAKRGMSWVHFNYIKKYISELEKNFNSSVFDNLIKMIENTSKLNLPYDEDMFYEQFTWKIGNALGCLDQERHVNEAKQIFQGIKDFNLSRNYDPYRYVLIQFHKALKNDPIYSNIVDWWGTDNFQSSDFEENTNDEGRTFPSLAEQVLTNYYKHLVEKLKNGSIIDDIEVQLIKLNRIIEANPDFKYLHYRRAQILQSVGKEDEAIKAFLPYAKTNRKQTWVWELLGDLHDTNQELKISCYCKALSIPNKEDFVTNIRLKLAEQLINKRKFDEAKTEIEQYYDFRSQNGYKIANRVNSWISMPWYQEAAQKQSNKSFYKNYLGHAEKVLHQDIPEQFIAVEYVNTEKSILNFIESRTNQGFFNYSEFDIKPKVGDVYKVKMRPEGTEGYHTVYYLAQSEHEQTNNLFKKFSGKITIHSVNSFGIVDCNPSVFVDGRTIKKYQLSDGDTVDGLAMANYDRKKKVWGWKLIKIQE